MTESKKLMKIVFIVILLLIILPLILFILVQFAPPKVNATSAGSDGAVDPGTERTAARERYARHTAEHAARQESREAAVSISYDADPEPERFDGAIGAINPNATRTKRATPYPPGEVPGDSGVIVNYAGSPDDMMDAPPPPSPQEDIWGGRTPAPIPPANMRGIGGVRRIDPNDPFFQQDIPNPFVDR